MRRSFVFLAAGLLAACQPSSAQTSGVTLLKRATALNNAGNYKAAIAVYDRAARKLPQIADWINIFAANSAGRLGDTLQVARRLKTVDDTLAADWGWRIRSRAFEEAHAMARALQYARAGTEVNGAAMRASAWNRVAELQRMSGNIAEQRKSLLAALNAAPVGEAAKEAALQLSGFSDLNVSDQLLTARALLHNGETSQGIALMNRVLDAGGLTDADRNRVRLDLARAYFDAAKYKDAIAQFSQLNLDGDGLYLYARAQLRAGQEREARATFKSITTKFPATAAAARAYYVLADMAHDSGDLANADSLFRRAALSSRSDESMRAFMRMGDIALLQNDFKSAANSFQQLRSRSNAYQTAATYWLAVSDARIGKGATADSLLRTVAKAEPLSYYGLRAADLLKQPPDLNSLPKGPVTKPADSNRAGASAERWSLLHAAEWDDAAAYDVARARKRFRDPAGLYALAEKLRAQGGAHLGISIGRDLLDAGRPWDRRLLAIVYPMPYRSAIQQLARQNNLDPYFVAGLIRQESQFNPGARSGVGAIGLMQVMPATGRQLRKAAQVGKVTEASLMEPETNLKIGTRFLAELMKMYDGRADAVLVAYNAGPARADRWRHFPEYANPDLFAERIPFDETREYVKIVKTNAAIYRALYGPEPTVK